MIPEKVMDVKESTTVDGMGCPGLKIICLSGPSTIDPSRNKKASIRSVLDLFWRSLKFKYKVRLKSSTYCTKVGQHFKMSVKV